APAWGRWNSDGNGGPAPSVGGLFFPLDHKLELGGESYSPRVLQKVVRMAARIDSHVTAADALLDCDIVICPKHVGNLAAKVGAEWAAERDREVREYQEHGRAPARTRPEPPTVVSVHIDGGRVQMRQDDSPPGVHGAGWKEIKTAACLSWVSSTHAEDPQPKPPAKFTDPERVRKL